MTFINFVFLVSSVNMLMKLLMSLSTNGINLDDEQKCYLTCFYCQIGTKIGVVVDMDLMIMIVVTKRQKDKKMPSSGLDLTLIGMIKVISELTG